MKTKFEIPEEIKLSRASETREVENNKIADKIAELQTEIFNINNEINKILEAENKTIFDTIIINGTAEFTGNVVTNNLKVERIGEVLATQLLKDIVKYVDNFIYESF